MNLKCYIVDDEAHAIRVLEDYIRKTPGLELAGSSTEPLSALTVIAAAPPDILFLDVDMPEISGLRFADLTGAGTAVIFTTAYREYAVEAFEKRAVDYLLKPVFYERFLAAVQKVREARSPAVHPDFFVKTGTKGKLERVTVDEITYIQGADAYITIFSKNGKLMTYMGLGEVMKRLPEQRFSRIHKSFIVCDALVHILEPGQLRLRDGTVLQLGPSYREAFQRKMQGRP